MAANSYAYYNGICFPHFFLTIGLTYNVISIIISLFKHKLHINDSIPYNSIFWYGGIIIIAVSTLIKICFGVQSKNKSIDYSEAALKV